MQDAASTEKSRHAATALCLPESLAYYHSCHTPLRLDAPPEMVIGDAVDDLADIWGDLERGLRVYTSEGPAGAAYTPDQSA